jgi:hypothetical protein
MRDTPKELSWSLMLWFTLPRATTLLPLLLVCELLTQVRVALTWIYRICSHVLLLPSGSGC